MRQIVLFAIVMAWAQFHAGTVFAVVAGQLDDFTDPNTHNWTDGGGGSGNPPTVIASDGPAGAGDAFLNVTSTGEMGAGGRLTALNRMQWSGDYLAEGISELTADVNNLGESPLNLRLAFTSPGGGGFASTQPVSLSSGSGWQSASFPLSVGDFTAVSGNGVPLGTDFNLTLGGVTQLRVLSSSVPAWRGDIIAASLGIDNIQAVAPSTPGDFNNDTFFNLADLQDLYLQGDLVAGVSASQGDPFDLDDSLIIDKDDLAEWLGIAATANGYSSPYLRGDTDNVGAISEAPRTVDITDFNSLATNFDPLVQSATPNTWDRGNFDGDNDVDITDFNDLATNFFPLGYGATAVSVPEPGSALTLIVLGLMTVYFRYFPGQQHCGQRH